MPAWTYDHTGGPCSITGGYVYRGSAIPDLQGTYFFADYCSGWIKTVDPANGYAVADFATGINAPVDLQVDSTGSLYYLAYGGGAIYRITSPLANSAFVDLALYRPSSGQFFIRSSVNGSVTAIAFGAPGGARWVVGRAAG